MLEENLIIFTEELTPRLEYISKFIFNEILGCKFSFTNSIEKATSISLPILNYSNIFIENSVQIFPEKLLFKTNIEPQKIEVFTQNEISIFFANNKSSIGFDIFAASFYLLTRYEEYLPFIDDEFGRFPHTESVAFKNNFLQQPLINVWCQHLKSALQYYFPEIIFSKKEFKYLSTYDIDMAFSYQHKGAFRNIFAGFKDLLTGKFASVTNRIQVLFFNKKDPFDCFDALEILHKKFNMQPIYFFLVGKNGKLDKNILLTKIAMQNLIKKVSENYPIGIHPSFESNFSNLIFKEELNNLENVANKKITINRQHYIRYKLPETFNLLVKNKIHQDYSLGYGSINGFRASTCTPHYWFNIIENKVKDLKLFPFCFMDANSFFEQKQNVEQTNDELLYYLKICKKYNGNFIPIWHNFILGSDKKFAGWMEMYLSFLEKMHQ